MMSGLIVWGLIGPILAFLLGVIFGAWDEDAEQDVPSLSPPDREPALPAYPLVEPWLFPLDTGGMAGRVPPGPRYSPGPAWRRLHDRVAEQPLASSTRPCRCPGSKGQWP